MKSHELFSEVSQMLLRPLVRFCLRHALKIQDLEHNTKRLFVEEAVREIHAQGEKENVSRVAAITGLHRREVTALMQEGGKPEPAPPAQRKVIGKWQSVAEYLQPNGQPRALSCAGTESEFAELVRSVSQDLNPYTVLFELERAEIIERKDDSVVLKRAAYFPAGDVKKGFQLAASDISDLIGCVEGNVLSEDGEKNFHLKTHYDNIVVEAVPKIREWFLKKGATLHDEARAFLSKFDKDLNPKLGDKPAGVRAGVGSFSFTVNQAVVESPAVQGEKRVKKSKR